MVHIKTDDGEDVYLTAYFKTLLREEKHVKLGDRVEIEYYDDENFTIKKLTGKKK